MDDWNTDDRESPSDADGASQDTTYREALSETRRVIDVQVEMVENTDEEILTVMRINILALGGVVTLLAYLPDLVAAALPWVVVSSLVMVCAILISGFIYRGVTLYAGFGDHGHDGDVPSEKIAYSSLIRTEDDVRIKDQNKRKPPRDAFRASLLNEHQTGIGHNNVEIKYRSQIHQQVILLLLTAVILLGIGLVAGISEPESPYEVAALAVATSFWVVVIGYTLIKSIGLIGRFIQTNADPSRFSYGYAFDRRYPYLSRMCSFVLTYLYDPEDEKW